MRERRGPQRRLPYEACRLHFLEVPWSRKRAGGEERRGLRLGLRGERNPAGRERRRSEEEAVTLGRRCRGRVSKPSPCLGELVTEERSHAAEARRRRRVEGAIRAANEREVRDVRDRLVALDELDERLAVRVAGRSCRRTSTRSA